MDIVVARASEPGPESVSQSVPEQKKREYYTPEGTDEMPLEIYESENSTKYINKLLEVDGLLPQDLLEAVDGIDGYITRLMNERGDNPTTGAYRATLEGIKKDLGITKHASLETTIERVSKYIEAEQMLKQLKTLDEGKILKQLKKTPTKSLMELVMNQVKFS